MASRYTCLRRDSLLDIFPLSPAAVVVDTWALPFPTLPDTTTMPEGWDSLDFIINDDLTPNFAAMTYDNLMAYGTETTASSGECEGWTFHRVAVDDPLLRRRAPGLLGDVDREIEGRWRDHPGFDGVTETAEVLSDEKKSTAIQIFCTRSWPPKNVGQYRWKKLRSRSV